MRILPRFPAGHCRPSLRFFHGFGCRIPALIPIVVLALCPLSRAADIVKISPVTEKILAVEFSDGHQAEYDPTKGAVSDSVQHTSGLLDTSLADAPASYTLGSADDPAFAKAQAPVTVGRKSKGTGFTGPAPWDIGKQAPNKFLRKHTIYLEFGSPLQPGKTYTLTCAPGLSTNGNTVSFVFDPAKQESPSVHVSLLGFTPDAPKYAYISQWMGSFDNARHTAGGLKLDDPSANYTGAPFHVVNTDTGETVFSGTIAKRKDKTSVEFGTTVEGGAFTFGANGNTSMADMWEADFSSVTTPGRYRVVVDRMGTSMPFEIKDDIYREAFRTAMRAFFWQRSGIVKEAPGGVIFPRAHHTGDGVQMYYDPNSKYWMKMFKQGDGSLRDHDESVPGFDYASHPLDPAKGSVYGWYYDAGDWDSYFFAHQVIPFSLMWTYNMWPDHFNDGDVGNRYKLDPNGPWIDEGTNGLPDILDEARWQVDISRNNRDVLIANGYGTGGIPGYYGANAGVDLGGGGGGAAWKDRRKQALTAEDPECTYHFAGQLGYLAYTLNTFWHRAHSGQNHPEFAQLVKEGEAAYKWASDYIKAHPDEETDGVKKARMVGAAGMYAATGLASFNEEFLGYYTNGFDQKYFSYWLTPFIGQWAELLYAFLPPEMPGYDSSIRPALEKAKADPVAGAAKADLIDTMNNTGMRVPMPGRWITQGLFTTPSPQSAISHALLPEDELTRQMLHLQAAYFLGGNQENLSKLTGLGYRRERAAFVPNEWALYPSSSMVYRYRNLPGFTLYDRAGFDTGGHSGEGFATSAFYPETSGNYWDAKWPAGERRSNSRWSIAGSEFTVWELFPSNAMVYGALCKVGGAPVPERPAPRVNLNMAENAVLPVSGNIPLSVTGSPDLDVVEYYYNWQFIGRSSDASKGFRVDLDPSRFGVKDGTSAVLTAMGWNRKGDITWETPDVDRAVTFKDMKVVPVKTVVIGAAPKDAIPVNRTHALQGSVTPADATYPWIIWTSDNPAVATVDGNGVVTGVSAGSATITATTADGSQSAKLPLTTVVKPLTGIALAGAPGLLGQNSSAQLEAKLTPSDTSEFQLEWASSKPECLSVNSSGLISGVSPGEAVVTVKGANGISAATAPVKVAWQPTKALQIKGIPATLGVGQSAQLEVAATPSDASNKAVVWSSANPDVVSVDASGNITAHAPGKAMVTVKAEKDNVTASAAITVADSLLTGLKGRWSFDGDENDSVGGNAATLAKGCTFDSENKAVGTESVAMPPSPDQPCAIQLGGGLSGKVISISLWAYNPGTMEHQNWVVNNVDGDEASFTLFLNGYGGKDGRVLLSSKEGAESETTAATPEGTFKFNQWVHLVLVMDSDSGQATLYVDGTPYDLAFKKGIPLDKPLNLGAQGLNQGWNQWNGQFDEVRIYDRALNAEEVALLGKSGPHTTSDNKAAPDKGTGH